MRTWYRRQIAWLALCAVVFAAAAPAFAHWIASTTGLDWIEVCSATGLKRIPFDNGSKDAPAGEHAEKPCPFCRSQDHQPAVPAALFHIFFSDARVVAPSVAASLPLPRSPALPAWRSRAPPTFS